MTLRSLLDPLLVALGAVTAFLVVRAVTDRRLASLRAESDFPGSRG